MKHRFKHEYILNSPFKAILTESNTTSPSTSGSSEGSSTFSSSFSSSSPSFLPAFPVSFFSGFKLFSFDPNLNPFFLLLLSCSSSGLFSSPSLIVSMTFSSSFIVSSFVSSTGWSRTGSTSSISSWWGASSLFLGFLTRRFRSFLDSFFEDFSSAAPSVAISSNYKFK